MVRLDSVRRGKRRNEKISKRGRIILTGTTARAGADAASAAGSLARSHSSTRAWPRTRGARLASAALRSTRRDRRWRRRRRNHRRFHLRLGIRWFDRRNRERFRLRHHGRIRSHAHELKMLLARASAARPTAATARRSRSAAAHRRIMREIRRSDDWSQDKKKDQCVHEQRRNDPSPILFLLELLPESRITRSYFTSFGVEAITLTPAPRAASIAAITSEYFTVGSPLTKMILSGR